MGMGNPVTRRPTPPDDRDSYVIHIYRRGDTPEDELVGLIEPVGAGEAGAFRNRDELWERLSRSARRGRRRPRPASSD